MLRTPVESALEYMCYSEELNIESSRTFPKVKPSKSHSESQIPIEFIFFSQIFQSMISFRLLKFHGLLKI